MPVTVQVTQPEISANIQTQHVTVEPHVVTVVSAGQQGLRGVPGPAGNSIPAVQFAYGDATPGAVYTPPTDQIITSLSIVVTQVFNGTGAKVSIGTTGDPDLLVPEDETDLSILGGFGFEPQVEIEAGTAIKVFITPGAGATQGQATILIEYAEV